MEVHVVSSRLFLMLRGVRKLVLYLRCIIRFVQHLFRSLGIREVAVGLEEARFSLRGGCSGYSSLRLNFRFIC